MILGDQIRLQQTDASVPKTLVILLPQGLSSREGQVALDEQELIGQLGGVHALQLHILLEVLEHLLGRGRGEIG